LVSKCTTKPRKGGLFTGRGIAGHDEEKLVDRSQSHPSWLSVVEVR